MTNLYEELVKHITENQNQFYRAAYYYVKSREAALDVVQNAICKALENYEKLQVKEAMPSWFYRILINEALMYLRKEKKYIAWDETDNDFLEGSFEEPAYEPKIEVKEKIADLPTEMQVVIQLHFFEDKTLKEVSEITNTNLNTVKSRLYAACKRLGKELEAEDDTLRTRYKKAREKEQKLAEEA
ncbi:MAG: RNA polymerase sigma factor [Lachnospiraceae bacterium]|nr:RNA polymerase sigma factor [Lachnospiraceae bacterium]